MAIYLAVCPLGVFAFDQNEKLLEYRLFEKNPEKISAKLERNKAGEILEEEREILEKLLERGLTEIVSDKKISYKNVTSVQQAEHPGKQVLQKEFRQLAIGLKWVKDSVELNRILAEVGIAQTKTALQKPKKDRIMMHAAGLADELDRDLNNFSERLREWWGLHFPEAAKAIPTNEKLAEIVSESPAREEMTDPELKKMAQNSAGMPFEQKDIEAVQSFAAALSELFSARAAISKYIEQSAGEIIPNIAAIAGPMLGARLLAASGGLEKMARMPASTIQLLGAEKALFRHMRENARAPKYGIIFGHPEIQHAPRENRGKVARLIAAKLSLAAKIDFFSGTDRSGELKKSLDEQIRKAVGGPV